MTALASVRMLDCILGGHFRCSTKIFSIVPPTIQLDAISFLTTIRCVLDTSQRNAAICSEVSALGNQGVGVASGDWTRID